MSPAYLKQAPAGVPGDVTRAGKSNIEPAMLIAVSTVYAQLFGIPVKYATGGVQQFNGGAETKASFAGVLIREAPSIAGTAASDSTFNDSVPNPDQPQGILIAGYCAVKCWDGTPARGGVVYIQIITSGGIPVGAFRATADGGNTIALDFQQASWATDGLDADLTAELRVQVPA
jgi:hypothetical protein